MAILIDYKSKCFKWNEKKKNSVNIRPLVRSFFDNNDEDEDEHWLRFMIMVSLCVFERFSESFFLCVRPKLNFRLYCRLLLTGYCCFVFIRLPINFSDIHSLSLSLLCLFLFVWWCVLSDWKLKYCVFRIGFYSIRISSIEYQCVFSLSISLARLYSSVSPPLHRLFERSILGIEADLWPE